MGKNILKQKSFDFAVLVVKWCKGTKTVYSDRILINQLMKAGTSIGANIREAEFAQSRNDFISKMSIALKEANETEYWLLLLKESRLLSDNDCEQLHQLVSELIRMLISTVKTSKK